MLNGNWTGGQIALDNNLYWNTRGPVHFGAAPLADWQKSGHDVHSMVADPLFVAPQAHDFRLRPGSLALALGFQPIDLTGVGAAK